MLDGGASIAWMAVDQSSGIGSVEVAIPQTGEGAGSPGAVDHAIDPTNVTAMVEAVEAAGASNRRGVGGFTLLDGDARETKLFAFYPVERLSDHPLPSPRPTTPCPHPIPPPLALTPLPTTPCRCTTASTTR